MKIMKKILFINCLAYLHLAYASAPNLPQVDPEKHPIIKKLQYVTMAQKMRDEGGLQAQQYDTIEEHFKTQPFIQAVQHFKNILEQNAKVAQSAGEESQE